MKIAIIGCRGIPNRYGGFEQFAEKLAPSLVRAGHQVYVYNPHNHPCKDRQWNGVERILCYDPEYIVGQAGQFIYDWNCINNSRRYNFDVILQLGNTSSSIWHWRMPRGAVVVTNMDGLEWMRRKYSVPVRKFLKYAEKLAAVNSHYLVADNPAIKDYLVKTYNRNVHYIPYGADVVDWGGQWNEGGLQPGGYFLVIARMQADNHIGEIVRAHIRSNTGYPLVLVGNINNGFGKRIKKKYGNRKLIFLNSVFDQQRLNLLRANCRIYFHGHSSGGTNPSLLEAMAASAPICAHDNPFNKAVLKNNAWYFSSENDIIECINADINTDIKGSFIRNNLHNIKTRYNWDLVTRAYLSLFEEINNA